jgi:hypothetical protein
MQYELRRQDGLVYHVESGHCAGRVVPLKNGKGFSVHRTMMVNGNEPDKIGVVRSMNEVLPKLTDYYERNWPQWKRTRKARQNGGTGYTMYTEFIKWSVYGVFTVNQRDDGPWIVTRCEDVLLHRGKKATFETPELARYVADLHERDGFGNFPALDDGYSWDGRPWIGPGARHTLSGKASCL